MDERSSVAMAAGVTAQLGLRQVVAQAPVAIAVVDLAGEVMCASDPMRDLVERRLGHDLASTLRDGDDAFQLDGRRCEPEEWPVARALRTGEEVSDEEFSCSPPGEDRLVVCVSARPVRDDAGTVLAAIAVVRDVTDRTRLDEERAYLAFLFDSLDDAVIATDDRFVVTAWNRGAERMFGWTADEARGRPVYELLPQDYADEQQGEELRELTARGRWRGERVWFGKGGERVRADGQTVAVRGDGDAVVGYLCLMRDVSEQRRAEEAVRRAKRVSETMLERITDAFYALDREWRFTYVNERTLEHASEVMGRPVTREELLGQSAWDVVPWARGTAVEDHYRRALRTGQPEVFEYRHPGTDRWVDVHAYPSEQGLAVYFRDISDRKRTEREREARARQQEVLAELGLRALASEDLQAVLDDAVACVAEHLGAELVSVAELVGPEELVLRAGSGWPPGAVGRARSRTGAAKPAGFTLATGKPVVSDDVLADGRFAVPPVLREQGPAAGVMVIIGDRRDPFGVLAAHSRGGGTFSRVDVSFVQTVANVLASVVERSRAQERVREAREAERSRIARDLHDEALRELTHALALAHGSPGQATGGDELVAALERAGQQVRAAVNDLRLRDHEDRSLPELLQALVALHRAAQPDLDIDFELDDTLPPGALGASGTEFLKILGEALANARRHASARRVRVAVSASEATLHAEVADDGAGFDPAERTEATRHGLRGMRERAALCGGHVDVASRPGAGTTVRVEVPFASGGGGHAEQPVRVLLVEDHAAVREAVAAAFEHEAGFAVVAQAESLAQARERLAGVDVAVLDLGLPDGFGADLVEELRRASPGAQAVVLSASFDRAEIARAVERGAAGVLAKTVGFDEVVQAVRQLRAGAPLLPLDEVVELLRFAGRRREREHGDRARIAELTPREREVLQALADGLDSRQIAQRLFITVRTERNHVANILAKLGVHSQLQALVFALRYDVVEVRRDPASLERA